MDESTLQAEIERLGPWMHDVELAPGLRTGAARGSDDPDRAVLGSFSPDRMMEEIVGPVYGGGLDGRSFLDCACNAGGHSLAAARLGASRVFGFDARQYWLDQAAFLARFADAPQVEFRRLALSDLPALELEPFDVTLFSGLFYHLPDPVAGLKIAADLTRELLIVNTSALPRAHEGLVLSRESPTVALSGIDGLAWLPTGPAVMAPILAWCGFPHMRVDRYWRPPGRLGWWRMQILAARDEATFERFDARRPDARLTPSRRLTDRLRTRLARVLKA